jgi:hypothetical protein
MTGQKSGAIAIGYLAGAVGITAGATQGQDINAIAIGNSAGQSAQSSGAIAIGVSAGASLQGSSAIAIGTNAGLSGQYSNCIAIGYQAGYNNQGPHIGSQNRAIAIGDSAGYSAQSGLAIAIGYNAGKTNQGIAGGGIASGQCVAIGTNAGAANQSAYSIAIGNEAGTTGQGSFAIAIGTYAGRTNQATSTIVINAQNFTAVTGAIANATYIAPIRNVSQTTVLGYDTTTSEISYYQSFKTGNFVFDNYLSIQSSTSFNGPFGLRGQGSFLGTGATQLGSFATPSYVGVVQWACSANINNYASESSTSSILFDNLLLSTSGGSGITFIFRPFSLSTSVASDMVIGLGNIWTSTAGVPGITLGIWWRYTGATGNWTLIADNGAAIATVVGSQANTWCEINILRTGVTSFTSTFTIIGGATTTGSGSVASSTAITYIGLLVQTTATVAKYIDLDYISAEFNA